MTLSSLSFVADAARRTLLRFPAVLLSGIVAATVAIYMVGAPREPAREMVSLLLVAALGIPFFYSLALFWEKSPRGEPLPSRFLPPLIGLALLALYWRLLDREPGFSGYLRYAQLSLAFHLSVAFAPFLGRGEMNGFWQFNRRLFQRFILSAVYASVFFVGLALALAAVENLFGVRVEGELYFKLWIFTVFVFQTWHFLGGTPSDLKSLDLDQDHPKALKIFSQYLLVPLVVLYLLILYLFTLKILWTRQWPQGWVGWLVSYAAIFGVLTLLLLHPGRDDRASRWIATLGRSFYVAILPLLGLLFAALGKRLDQYGLTERRYFLLVLGLWLTGLSSYMLFSKAKSIKVVPVSLCLTALLTSVGPWGAYQLSRSSQSRRLETLLTRNHLLAEGKTTKSTTPVSPDDLREIGAAVDYLVTTHGPPALNRWSRKSRTGPALAASARNSARGVVDEFMAEMNLAYSYAARTGGGIVYYRAATEAFDLSGYTWMSPFTFYDGSGSGGRSKGFQVRFDARGRTVEVLKGSSPFLKGSVEPLLERLKDRGSANDNEIPPADMALTLENGPLRARLSFTYLGLQREEDGTLAVKNGSGYLFVADRPAP